MQKVGLLSLFLLSLTQAYQVSVSLGIHDNHYSITCTICLYAN